MGGWYPDLVGNNDSFSIAFTIGHFDVRWYALISMLGYIVAICVYLLSIWKRYKISVDVGFYYIFVAIPMILLGARFWSACIGDLQWSEFFKFGTGGLAIQGGVVFGIIGALIYFPIILHFPKYHKRVVENGHVYIQRPSMWLYADAIVPTILLGQAIGRWGNFFNGELFGHPVSADQLSWLKAIMPGVYDHMYATNGATIPLDPSYANSVFAQPVNMVNPKTGETVSYIAKQGTFFQPLFLYESFLNIIAFCLIYGLLAEIKQIKAGVITGLYFVCYGMIRFGMESQRNQDFAFTGTYILNGILLTIGVILVVYCQFFATKLRKYYIWFTIKAWFHYQVSKYQFKGKVNRMKRRLGFSKNQSPSKSAENKLETYIQANKPLKENFGYAQKPRLVRENSDLTFFAGR